jgi:hypothetical protein
MKAKSLTGSKLSLISAGLVAWAGALRTMVWPSGELGRDRRAGAAAVFDHHWLAEVLTQLRRQRARQDIVGPARREADKEANRLARVALRGAGRRRQHQRRRHRVTGDP